MKQTRIIYNKKGIKKADFYFFDNPFKGVLRIYTKKGYDAIIATKKYTINNGVMISFYYSNTIDNHVIEDTYREMETIEISILDLKNFFNTHENRN